MTGETTDPYVDALNAERLRTRIAAVLRRVPSVPVRLVNGVTLLRGRRRSDRMAGAADRRVDQRRKG